MVSCRGRVLLCLAALVCAAWVAPGAADFCHGAPDPNAQPNLLPLWQGEPRLVRSVANGSLYQVGDQGGDVLNVVHLWGEPYYKGLAHGQLMQQEAQQLLSQAYAYFVDQAEAAINGTLHTLGFPQDVIDWMAAVGIDTALDLEYEATVNFTGDYFYQEMQGLADGAGVDYYTVRRVHMIGELTKGSCSMFGAWGKATASTGGGLLQLRALDWDTDGPFKNFPQLTVYHNDGSPQQGQSFVNVGWSGWIASITGASEAQTAISEIGVYFSDASFGNESRVGIPFTNILRDILQFDATLDDAKARITAANRTCDLILGVGDAKPGGGFTGVQYSYSVANFINDTDLQPAAPWHPPIEDVVYFGMDWLCPGYDSVLAKQLQTLYGNLTAENTARYVTSVVQTGSLHVAVYDLAHMQMLVAVAGSSDSAGPVDAYARTFHQLDLKQVFATPPPAQP